jgi:death-on-curing family protein
MTVPSSPGYTACIPSCIVKNHPFLDGNERVGAVAAIIFLELKGYDFTAPQGGLAKMIFGPAKDRTDPSRYRDPHP